MIPEFRANASLRLPVTAPQAPRAPPELRQLLVNAGKKTHNPEENPTPNPRTAHWPKCRTKDISVVQ